MSEETIRFLIEQKITFINTAVNACMLWWVSSIVFCGSVLGAVWLKRAELKEEQIVKWIGIILSTFFFAIAGFGFLAIYSIGCAQTEISSLAAALRYQGDFFSTELEVFRWECGLVPSVSFSYSWFGFFSGDICLTTYRSRTQLHLKLMNPKLRPLYSINSNGADTLIACQRSRQGVESRQGF